MPVCRLHQHATHHQKYQDRADFDHDHDVVGFGRLTYATHQQHSEHKYDQESREVEEGTCPLAALPDRSRPLVWNQKLELCKLGLQIPTESNRYRNVTDGVLKNQVPSNYPGKDLAQGRIGVCVRASRNGNHRCQLGIAEAGEAAGNRNQHERKRNGRSGRRPSMHDRAGGGAMMQKVQQQVENLRLEN